MCYLLAPVVIPDVIDVGGVLDAGYFRTGTAAVVHVSVATDFGDPIGTAEDVSVSCHADAHECGLLIVLFHVSLLLIGRPFGLKIIRKFLSKIIKTH